MRVINDKRLNEMIDGMKLYADMPCGIKINEFSAKDLYSAMVELRELRQIGTARQWVPVTERLPKHNQVVDVMYDHRRETDVLFTDLGWKQYFWNPEMGRFIDGVTYWMPLPPLPEKEASE